MSRLEPNSRRTNLFDRRAILQVGFSGILGVSLPALLAARKAVAESAAQDGRPHGASSAHKRVILVLLTGGPSHLDTLDLKPESPDGIRGEFSPIDTSLPGVQVCEHLPQLATRLEHLALVRSMAHRDNSHLPATHKLLTGSPMPLRRGSDLDNVLSRRDWPCYGAGLDYVRPRNDGIPNGVTLPHDLVEGPLTWPGQHAGFLGPKHDPWQIRQNPDKPDFKEDSLSLPSGISLDRVQNRGELLAQVNAQRSELAALAEAGSFSEQQQIAISMLTSGKVTQAFEIHRETDAVRERYGRNLFGQSLLLARRLVEAGVPIIQANMGIVQTWDTHSENFPKLKKRLLPRLDQGLSALIDDLAASGMLQDTLIAVLGEFGRTPKISILPGSTVPGRDHWAHAYSALFAGGGIQGGQVIGRTDKIGAYVVSRPYTPNDVGATIYHTLGIDPATEIHDRFGRPLRLNSGEVMDCLYTAATT